MLSWLGITAGALWGTVLHEFVNGQEWAWVAFTVITGRSWSPSSSTPNMVGTKSEYIWYSVRIQ